MTVDGRMLRPRFDLRNHSPTGFEWGYGGSGPAQLALALLADHFGDDQAALRLYQDFKREIVSLLAPDWRITSSMIDQWVKLFLERTAQG